MEVSLGQVRLSPSVARISSAAREVARNTNGRAGRQSITVSITSSGDYALLCT
jgi:hypothetical protein